jgi:hypothetical protein
MEGNASARRGRFIEDVSTSHLEQGAHMLLGDRIRSELLAIPDDEEFRDGPVVSCVTEATARTRALAPAGAFAKFNGSDAVV